MTHSIGIEQSHKIAAAKIIEAKLEIDKVYCSVLFRSLHTAELILEDMQCCDVPIVKDWRLCERHYGNLTGFNKRQMADKYGEEQVQAWRRGYDNIPPPIDIKNKYYHEIMSNPAFKDVPIDQFPLAESMHMCVGRVKPAWDEIKKEILQESRPMIIAHGTVARALIMHIEGMILPYILFFLFFQFCSYFFLGLSEEKIEKVNVPNCVPIVYEFNLKTGGLIGGSKYLGDPKYIEKMREKVASIGT